MKARWFLVGLALAALGAVSCATDVGTIDRTQHERLEKKQFAGVWYMNQTVIDIPFSGAWSFVGEMNFGATGKVVFDIQEKQLIAYPTVEYIQGSEEKWHQQKIFKYWDDACTSKDSESFECIDGVDNLDDPTRTCCFVQMYVGHPVAMFDILSHFDVTRRYNAQTGEQTNVLEENTTDLKWWQRKYVRVNWSKNQINDFTFMARILNQSPLDYYVQSDDPTNPDAPTFTPDYFDVVTKMYGDPGSTGACDIYGVSYGDCAPAVVKFRNSFRKVDVRQDYEPMRFHNEDRQALFGYFLTERNAYDEEYGLNEMGRVSFINRWNLWDKSFQETPVTREDGTPKPCFKDLKDSGCDTANNNGTKEFCKADDWFTRGTCVARSPLPFTQRGLRPIVYHVSYDLPEFLWAGTYRMAKVWSDSFKDTIAWLYLWEEKGRIVGQNYTKSCSTDAECTRNAVLDRYFELDAVLDGDLPKFASGKVSWTSIAKSVVALPNGRSVLVPDWKYPADLITKCGVRLINVAEGRSFGVKVNGTDVLSDVAPIAEDSLDPATPPHGTAIPFGSGAATFVITEGGNEVVSVAGECDANTVVTLVYDGTTLVKAEAPKASLFGLRVFNLTGQATDVSINGGLRQYALAHGQHTGYQQVPGWGNSTNLPADFQPMRLVLMPAGASGDVTCYIADGIGRCAGYDQITTDADFDRYEEIKASLPEMFVLCRNTYTPKVEGGALNDDEWITNRYVPWTSIKNATPDQLNALPSVNPCIDLLYGAEKQTPAERLDQAKAMKKIGDSRYSGVNWVSEAQFSSPLGYGPSAADPDSGQIFWGVANIYGAPLQTYGNMYRDLFDLILGKLDTADYVTGARIREFIAAKSRGEDIDIEQIAAPLNLADPKAIDPGVAGQAPPAAMRLPIEHEHHSHLGIFNTIKNIHLGNELPSQTLPNVGTSLGKQRLSALKGSQYEQMLMNDEVRYALDNDAPVSGSPLEWATLGDIQQRERERQIYLGKHAYCYGEFNDEGMLGMVKSWACLSGDPRPRCDAATFDALDPNNVSGSACCIEDGELLARSILQRYYTAVVEHEVGHTVGLRHNFAASTDLFNFQDKYYDIRTKDLVPCTIDDECEAALGQFCDGGYCSNRQVETCGSANDCGFAGSSIKFDTHDCVAGKCVEITRCGMHGECPAGSWCNGDDHVCYQGQGAEATRLATEVKNEGDGLLRVMAPRAELDESEEAQSRTVYQYTSLMDYGQRWNSDILDLGKYDKAAIRFGYGDLVDVYTNTRHLHEAIHKYYQAYGYDSESQSSDNLETSYWNYGIFFSQFYQMNNLIGVEANRSEGEYVRNRAAVPYGAVRDEHDMTANYYQDYADWSYIQVPYKFSGDEYNGNVGIYTWDTGVDPLEIVHNMGIQLKDYYLMDAFKRERYGAGLHGNPISYLTRLQSRYMDPMRGCGMYYALYAHVLKNYGWRGIWANARMMGYGLRRASEMGFELLARSMTSPAPGSYRLNVDKNLYQNISYTPGQNGSELDIQLGDGKYPYTTFWNGAGYYFWDHALYIGSFWEKLAALMTLTDSTVYFTTNYVGEQLNIGVGTSIGFNTMYPRQLAEIFGGMIAEDPSMYAGTATNDGKYVQKRIFDPDNASVYSVNPSPYLTEAAPATGPRVQPSIDNITLKLYMMVYGMAYLPASFDPSFLDSFTICMKGNGNCHDIGPISGIVPEEFEDPFTGKTFQAWGPTYTTDWYSPNLALVRKANDQKAAWEAAAEGTAKEAAEVGLRKTIEVLDMMRGVYEVFSKMVI